MGLSFVQGGLTECVFMLLSMIRSNSNPLHLQKVGRKKSARERKEGRKKKERKEEKRKERKKECV